MGLQITEQETTINIYRDSDRVCVYTSDTTMMTKLDKLVEREDCPDWCLIKEHYSRDKELVGKTYKTRKSLISFRSNVMTRKVSEEQKARLSRNLSEYHNKKKFERLKEELLSMVLWISWIFLVLNMMKTGIRIPLKEQWIRSMGRCRRKLLMIFLQNI